MCHARVMDEREDVEAIVGMAIMRWTVEGTGGGHWDGQLMACQHGLGHHAGLFCTYQVQVRKVLKVLGCHSRRTFCVQLTATLAYLSTAHRSLLSRSLLLLTRLQIFAILTQAQVRTYL